MPSALRWCHAPLLAPMLCGALLVSPSSHIAGQTLSPVRDTYWVSAGLGAGSEDFSGSATIAYQHGAHLFSLRAAATAGLFDDGFGDVALLYGRATRNPDSRYHAGAALGLAVVDGCESPGEGSVFGGCDDRGTVIGLPLEARVAWLPASFLGVGLYGFADFNRVRSFAGVTASVQLGRVR
jgi:hypothetical protein